ncbi:MULTISPECIES: lysophospholipid acyltransferase family protein [unclassified Sphingosinithalassobacter]|uniref:lysophospholipid acyltransferase family protein n=1 Tax=unclassified Sphingosinithalassobacter TaxID=2676235 RepID=UPI00165E0B47|nr:lysophospholipid acyltransferase family protein [Sphingosinithalassobacter sp. CS137]
MRTFLFQLVFYGLSVPIVLCAPLAALFGQRALIAYTHGWATFLNWCVRGIAGARVVIEGAPPRGATLFAAKHESYFETLELARRIDGPAIVMKRELLKIPVWGWASKVYGVIPVDRSASAKALRMIMREGQKAREAGRSVLIFPEGTRVAPGETPPIKSGFAGLYRALQLPVVPVAVQSGHVWSRGGRMRRGVIRIRFGEPFPPGLPRDEAEALVQAGINALDEAERR